MKHIVSKLKQHSTQLTSKLVEYLSKGVSPQKMGWAVALAVCIGFIPLLGSTTILCAAVAMLFRLNMPIMQMVSYAVYPLQLLFFIPFFKVGARLSGQDFDFSISEIQTMIAQDAIGTLLRFLEINLYAIGVWLVCLPFLLATLYFPVVKVAERIAQKTSKSKSSIAMKTVSA